MATKKTKKLAKRVPTQTLTPAQVETRLAGYGKRWGVTTKEAKHMSLVAYINRQDALDRYIARTSKPTAKRQPTKPAKAKAALSSPTKRKSPKPAAARVAKKPAPARKPKAAKKAKPAVAAAPTEA